MAYGIDELIEEEARKYKLGNSQIKELLIELDSLAELSGIDIKARESNIIRINQVTQNCINAHGALIEIRNSYRQAIEQHQLIKAQGIVANLHLTYLGSKRAIDKDGKSERFSTREIKEYINFTNNSGA